MKNIESSVAQAFLLTKITSLLMIRALRRSPTLFRDGEENSSDADVGRSNRRSEVSASITSVCLSFAPKSFSLKGPPRVKKSNFRQKYQF